MKLLKILLSCCSVLTPCFADELTVSFGQGRPPFVYRESNQWKGFEIAVSVQKTDEEGHYSDTLVVYNNFAISRASDQLVVDSVQDLKTHRPVAWQAAYLALGPAYAALFGPDVAGDHIDRYREFANLKSQNA